MYDNIIIGGGPAGMAAAIYLARQKINFLMLTVDLGGQTLLSSEVENYLGFHMLSGVELVNKFKEHFKDYKFDLKEGEPVVSIKKLADGFTVKTTKGTYLSKTILITTGAKHRTLGVPGEKEFYGKGVTYCATCDAPLFRDKQVHVIGGGNSAMEAALFLVKYANHVTILNINPELAGDKILIEKCKSDPKIRIIYQAKTVRFTGAEFINGIDYSDASGQEVHASTQGIFIEIGLIPVSDFIDIVEKDARHQIIIDKSNQTSLQGIWAAGDVTDVTEKQIAVAVGEGSKASLQIIKYLQSQGE